jgi:hypothetical protein
MPSCRCKFVEFFVLQHLEKNGLVTEDLIIENKKNTPLRYIEVSLLLYYWVGAPQIWERVSHKCKFVEFFVLQHHEKNRLVTEDLIIENKKNTPLRYIEVSSLLYSCHLSLSNLGNGRAME